MKTNWQLIMLGAVLSVPWLPTQQVFADRLAIGPQPSYERPPDDGRRNPNPPRRPDPPPRYPDPPRRPVPPPPPPRPYPPDPYPYPDYCGSVSGSVYRHVYSGETLRLRDLLGLNRYYYDGCVVNSVEVTVRSADRYTRLTLYVNGWQEDSRGAGVGYFNTLYVRGLKRLGREINTLQLGVDQGGAYIDTITVNMDRRW